MLRSVCWSLGKLTSQSRRGPYIVGDDLRRDHAAVEADVVGSGQSVGNAWLLEV